MAYENEHGKLKTYGKNSSLARFFKVTTKFLKNSQSMTKRLSAPVCRKGKQVSQLHLSARQNERKADLSFNMFNKKEKERNIMNGCQYGMM